MIALIEIEMIVINGF